MRLQGTLYWLGSCPNSVFPPLHPFNHAVQIAAGHGASSVVVEATIQKSMTWSSVSRVLDQGHIVETGRVADVFADAHHPVTRRMLAELAA